VKRRQRRTGFIGCPYIWAAVVASASTAEDLNSDEKRSRAIGLGWIVCMR
jgi:hypothetical protein